MKFPCPEEYYNNCANATWKCKVCAAARPTCRKLFYSPIDKSDALAKHPCLERRDKNRKTYKQSVTTEKRVEKEIARATIRSGAVHGDGDLQVMQDLRVEVKRRGARKSWNLTWDEYAKGKTQGIDIYAVEITDLRGHPQTMYMLEAELLGTLLSNYPSKTNERPETTPAQEM